MGINWLTGAWLALACAAAPGGTAGAPVSGEVREVRMLATDRGDYVFDPAELTIGVGERVRWVNVIGGPHNVAFYADRIPAGAREPLSTAMPDRLAGQDLAGKLLFADGETYEISFAGLPPGTYDYVCTPHEMAGMKARIVVVR
jgi:plastocyanin